MRKIQEHGLIKNCFGVAITRISCDEHNNSTQSMNGSLSMSSEQDQVLFAVTVFALHAQVNPYYGLASKDNKDLSVAAQDYRSSVDLISSRNEPRNRLRQ
uniref:Uncharacterized protein n=1 Tax=Ditylenchus dipsaci TaxID=166011 RepID=A0A915DXU7_9BILA